MSALLARQLVMSYGWNTTSYQILNPGFDYWFSPGGGGVVAWLRRRNVMLVAGAPVCSRDSLSAVCAGFEKFAASRGCTVCYVCAQERLHDFFQGSTDHCAVVLGAEPVWDPGEWDLLVRQNASLRAQLNRCRNKHVEIETAPAARMIGDAGVRRVLQEWVLARPMPPMHFLVETDIFDGSVADRVVFVARREGVAVAFLVASPVAARGGYLVEMIARRPSAPNGVGELLIDTAMRHFAALGYSYVSMGLVALAHAADEEGRGNPLWLRGLMRFARVHANRFYNFRGLEHFRQKMWPKKWEPVYAIANRREFSPLMMYALGEAFSGIPVWQALGIGVAKAVRQEFRHGRAFFKRR